jgi:hypothetical protein
VSSVFQFLNFFPYLHKLNIALTVQESYLALLPFHSLNFKEVLEAVSVAGYFM